METGKVYHTTNKSIAGYTIFNNETEYLRMKQVMQYYQSENPPTKFSYFVARQKTEKELINRKYCHSEKKLVRIIAYCLMPTHIHLILQQLIDNGISIYMSRIENSHTRHFNLNHRRKGPLWVGKSKRIPVETDEQLIHLTRYVHLNPATAYLVDKPELWRFSSYHEYITEISLEDRICDFKHILEIKPDEYKKFVNDQISYQRELAVIKDLVLE